MDESVDWRAFLAGMIDGPLEFAAPAQEGTLRRLEGAFSVELPRELRELLSQADGVRDEHGCSLVWNARKIVEENQRFRDPVRGSELCMSFDELLFFSDAPGNGDAYAYCILPVRGFQREGIFRWDHEDDSRVQVAPWLRSWVESELGPA